MEKKEYEFDNGQVYFRAPRMDDIPAVVDLYNAHSLAITGEPTALPQDFESSWTTPGFDLSNDARVAASPDGNVIGYAIVQDFTAPHVQVRVGGRVHPDYWRRGIGSLMMEWAEKRALSALSKAPETAQVALYSGSVSTDEGTIALLEKYGFQPIRHFLRLDVDLDQKPPDPIWPAGITVRPGDLKVELEEMVRTHMASFQDHWGYVEQPFAQMVKILTHQIQHIPFFDPDLWYVAMDGERMAGLCLCLPKTPEREDTAEVIILGVRREWRRQGLGLALLHHAFNEFYRRGIPRADLGVDADSLTGATRLYEKAGMYVSRVYNNYEKVLREGEDLTTRDVGDSR